MTDEVMCDRVNAVGRYLGNALKLICEEHHKDGSVLIALRVLLSRAETFAKRDGIDLAMAERMTAHVKQEHAVLELANQSAGAA